MSYVLLILGFLFLIKGADLFVEGASSVARRFGIPPILIGLTIVSFGTSAPEAAVSISSALKDANDLTLGNVVGSNIFNLLMVIGLGAAISPMTVQRNTIKKEMPFLLLNNIVLLILIGDIFLRVGSSNILDRGDGLILLSFFIVFMYYLVDMAFKTKEKAVDDIEIMRLRKSVIFIIAGGIGIWLGGEWVVSSSVDIATSFGISQTLVGLTIIAIGTSLPELVTSIVAASKGENDIAIGNVVGSNIFNILLVLGISATISPIAVEATAFYDIAILSVMTVVVFYFSAIDKKISKGEGLVLVTSYLIYMGYIIAR